ncbi:MAG: sigma-70 family RNA polymerase sigma factor [Hyphomicrobium sp.]
MEQKAQDRILLEAVGKGDARAFERLFTLHSPRVFRFLTRKVANTATAEELLNEVFLAAWQSASRFEGRSEPLTWLLSIAHNKAVSTLRKRREVLGLVDEAAAEIADEDDTPEVVTQKLDKGQIMRACIDRLSEEHRTILDLVYYQERSISEIAEILCIPENTVKTRMFYARKKLSEHLKARGIDRGWP